MSKNIIITGGFGFIGSHLCEVLLRDNSEVRIHVVDDLSTSPIDALGFAGHLNAQERFTYTIGTVADYFSQRDLPIFDEVYHLANVVGPVGVLQHAGEILRRTVVDTYAVSDYCERNGAKFCDISTSEVYGGGRDGYCSEGDTKIIPAKNSVRLEYSVAKLGCEISLMNKATLGKLYCTMVRPFNVAGPRQATAGGFVLPRFIEQALAGKDITVYGAGEMVRAFTHVDDVARGIMLTMRNGLNGNAYNIGNPSNKTSILHLAELVLEVVGGPSRIVFVDPKQLWGPLFEEANDKYPDADRAINELKWIPQYGLIDTIRAAAAYIQEGRRW